MTIMYEVAGEVFLGCSTDTMRVVAKLVEERQNLSGLYWVPAKGFEMEAGEWAKEEPQSLHVELDNFANALRSEVQHQEEGFKRYMFMAKQDAETKPKSSNEDLA